ncbi:MAG: shikimate kinase [Thermoplasmata archaeon]
MHGVGTSNAAITIVNALPTGIGSAAGIDLAARAVVDLHPSGSSGKWDVRMDEAARTPLVVAALTDALRRFAPGSSGTAELTVRSEIPVARGLKSSSAVSSAIVLAVAHATDSACTLLDAGRLSARVARAAGLSATGALDDALAGLSSGVVVTDNTKGELIASFALPADLEVALLVPRATHRPSSEWAGVFRAERAAGEVPVGVALRGDWAAAMNANTELVERVMRYDYSALRSTLLRNGALASGVSGMGPALATVAARSRLDGLIESIPEMLGERRRVRLSSGPRIPTESP